MTDEASRLRRQFAVLGPLEVQDASSSASLPLRGQLQRRLLSALVAWTGRASTADELADVLWPQQLPSDAASAVHTHVSRLRRAIGDDAIATGPSGYRLVARDDDIDERRFTRLVAEGVVCTADRPAEAVARFDEAIGLWRGAPYADLADADVGRTEAVRLEELRLVALEGRIAALLTLGQDARALVEAESLAAAFPLRERPRAHLMVAQYRTGRHVDALRGYDSHRRRLADELGLEPSLELRALERQVLEHRIPAPPPPPAAGPTQTSERRASTAPPWSGGPHRLVGRDAEIATVDALLDEHAIVTVHGSGGIGKTTVARAVAARAAGRFDAVHVVELAGLERPGSPTAIAGMLGHQSLEAAVVALTEARPLVVLDNCEHVLDAAAHVAGALTAVAPSLRLLVTSREPLGVDREQVVTLAPLGVPDTDDVTEVVGSPAVRLFVDRARAAGAATPIDGSTAPVLAELCRRLDGVPLALELAAARSPVLTPSEILAHLHDRFALLTRRQDRGPTRHRTLAATVQWSLDLLDADERRCFRRVGVFGGPFDADAAHAVIGDGSSPTATINRLGTLVERSLLTRVDHGTTSRYVLLETLREYAEAQLVDANEWEPTYSLLVDHFLDLLWGRGDRGSSAWSAANLGLLLAEYRNVMRCLQVCIDQDEDPTRAVALLLPLWATIHQGCAGEIGAIGQRFLARWPHPDHPGWADAASVIASAWLVEGDLDDASDLATRALTTGTDDRFAPVLSRRVLGLLDRHADRLGAAFDQFTEAADAARRVGMPPHALQLDIFAAAVQGAAGHPDRALAAVRRAHAEAQTLASPILEVWATLVEGQLLIPDQPAAAAAVLEEAEALARSLHYPWGATASRRTRGIAAMRTGDHATAAALLRAALVDSTRRGDRPEAWLTMRWSTALLTHAGRPDTAAHLASTLGPCPGVPVLAGLEQLLQGTIAGEAFGRGGGGPANERAATMLASAALGEVAAAADRAGSNDAP